MAPVITASLLTTLMLGSQVSELADSRADSRAAAPVGAYVSGQEYAPQAIDPYDDHFRAAHPVRVFVAFDESALNHRRGHGRRSTRFGKGIAHRAIHQLPGYVEIVHHPRAADVVVRAQANRFNIDFQIVDIDREDKKYKKSRRFASGQCGIHQRAYYDEVKVRGTAHYSFAVKARVKGVGTHSDLISGRARESYKYSRNLKARTNCGITPTHVFPSNGVEKLFHRASDHYQSGVRQDLRHEVAEEIAEKLTHVACQHIDAYYRTLAARLTHWGY